MTFALLATPPHDYYSIAAILLLPRPVSSLNRNAPGCQSNTGATNVQIVLPVVSQAVLPSPDHCFGPAVYFQFVVDGGDMVLDRAFSNHERICNLFIRLPLCQQLQYLQFAWAQRRYRISWLSCK